MNGFQKLIDFGNLYSSYLVSMQGKGNKKSAMQFGISALENLITMKRQLIERTYEVSKYSQFIVMEPKQRIITSGSFRDKVLQHCLCDYVLLPKLKNVFILDNYAGQIGKGTLFGLDRLSEKLCDFYNKFGCDGYILKCDITKFFYSINHDAMKRVLRSHFQDEDILWICDLLIDSTEGDGLPLGNQSSQVFALMYLNELDHLITEDLRCEYYGRYTDDFYLISNDKEYLKDCLKKIETFLGGLKLTLNSKTEIVPLRKGIRFLGFHTYITEEGKVIRKLTGDRKRQMKKKLLRNARAVKSGKMSKAKFYEKFDGMRNHVSHGNCYKLICSLDQFVESLLE